MRAPFFKDEPVKGVVFDLDGTLIHTTVDFELMKHKVFEILSKRDVPSSMLNVNDTIADNLDRVLEYVSIHRGERDVLALCSAVTRSMNRTEMERVAQTRPIDGALNCLLEMKNGGIKIGLLTRGSRDYALAALSQAGLDVQFDAMVCRDDFPEEEAKPNGMAMRRIMIMLNLESHECILIGDHLIDLKCAISSSVRFIGVLTGAFGSEEWTTHRCKYVMDSVRDLPSLLSMTE